MNDHHLLLGRLVDCISGRTIDDTHDERYRQKIARLLLVTKGYKKTDILSNQSVMVNVDSRGAKVPVTFTVHIDGRAAMLIQYGPGSLVTRHRPTLALGRLAAPYPIPVVVVSNGEQADILDGATGRVLRTGLHQIPSRQELRRTAAEHTWNPISHRRAEMEARIVMAYEVDDRCPCDSDVCAWDSEQTDDVQP